jgi:hypothetical protein
VRLLASTRSPRRGTLTGDVTVKVPNVSKTWQFWNRTTGAHFVYVQVPSGVSPNGLIQIPQGACLQVICDGNGNLIREDDRQIGTFSISGKATAGAGEVACDGTSYSRTALPDLFNKIGTTWGSVDSTHFTVPLLTDTNRFLRAGGGSGPAVGTYQASQNLAHTHAGASFSGTTGTESADHTHSFSGTTGTESAAHSHSGGVTFQGITAAANLTPGNGLVSPSNTGNESATHTHSFSGTTGSDSVTHTHSFSGTTGTIPSSGGSEARPESAAVLICIRY